MTHNPIGEGEATLRDGPSSERGSGARDSRTRPLAGLGGARPPAPPWFLQALAMPVEQRRIIVEGAGIEALAWGERTAQGVLLIHGSMAHARWWQPVAQLLAQRHRVVSFSFSGMGGSDWRDAYSIDQMAREAIAVTQAHGLLDASRRPAVLAHSFGGQAASVITDALGERLLGTIMVDSLIMPGDLPQPPAYKARSYTSEAEALERFRFAPEEPGGLLYVVDAIARASVKLQGESWTWRFDPNFFAKCTLRNAWVNILRARCPLAFVRGEMSTVVLREDFALQRQTMPKNSPFVEIPKAYHHIMVEQPIALTAALEAILEGWRVNPATAGSLV